MLFVTGEVWRMVGVSADSKGCPAWPWHHLPLTRVPQSPRRSCSACTVSRHQARPMPLGSCTAGAAPWPAGQATPPSGALQWLLHPEGSLLPLWSTRLPSGASVNPWTLPLQTAFITGACVFIQRRPLITGSCPLRLWLCHSLRIRPLRGLTLSRGFLCPPALFSPSAHLSELV